MKYNIEIAEVGNFSRFGKRYRSIIEGIENGRRKKIGPGRNMVIQGAASRFWFSGRGEMRPLSGWMDFDDLKLAAEKKLAPILCAHFQLPERDGKI